MLKRWMLILGLLCPLLACATEVSIKPFAWRYGTGSNIDSFCTTKAEFYRQKKMVAGYPGGGCNAGAPHKNIINQKYYWAGGGGLPTDGVPVPDKAVIEMVSFHDRKRYRIKVDLPADLEQQMRQKFMMDGKIERRHWLYFGLAPGGYFEVLLQGFRLRPDLLLARGIAEEVTDDWRDKAIPLPKQYEKRWSGFDREYGELFKQYPIPLGMDWAPIMDDYRAKQPRTDIEPVD
jgi:hypothetical protein